MSMMTKRIVNKNNNNNNPWWTKRKEKEQGLRALCHAGFSNIDFLPTERSLRLGSQKVAGSWSVGITSGGVQFWHCGRCQTPTAPVASPQT
jgi:hypothetical protein